MPRRHSNFHPNYNDVNGGLPALGRLRSLAICVGASRFSGGRLANRRESRSLFTDTAACTTAGCTAFYARHEPSSFGTAVVRTTTAATKTATPSTTTTLAAKLVTTTALHRNKSNTTATSTASTARIQSATNSTLKTKTATAGSATGEATTAIATKLINKSHQSSFAALANTVDGGATASHSPCRKPSNPPPAHSAAVVPTAQTTAVAAISAPASSTTAATTTTPVSRTSSSAPPTPSPLRRTRRQSTLYTNPLGGTGTSPQTPTPHAPRRASPSHRGRISPSSGSPHRAHLLLTMDGARPVYNYYHPSHGSTSAMSAGIGGGIAAGGGGSAGIGSGHNYGYRRPSSAVRRSMVRSQTSARSRRRASSARSSRQDGANLMDRQCALVLMYGIYFFYVLACFGAISTFAGLMLQISSKQPDAHDKGKIISGVGIGVCCTCFLIAFYCRSVKLDDKIFESIKETAPIVEIDDLILQRVGSAYYYNPQPSVERRHTLASSNQKASWWQMRHGDADEISIYSGGGGTRPGSAASSIIGQGAHAFHPHIIIPRGFHHAEYIPASEVCSSIHSSPLHGSSPGPQTPLSFMSIDIPEEPEPDLERPSTSRVPIG